MIERLDPDRILIAGGDESDIRKYIESDFRIRSGQCPNGCGLMAEHEHGQNCTACGFWCNTKAERGTPQ